MKNREHQHPRSSTNRWMVSYAELLTVLLAFFMVMYSISNVNQGKYKVLSQTLQSVFQKYQSDAEPEESTGHLLTPPEDFSRQYQSVMQSWQEISSLYGLTGIANQYTNDSSYGRPYQTGNVELKEAQLEGIDNLNAMREQLVIQYQDEIEAEEVSIMQARSWLEIVFNSDAIFDAGQTDISQTGYAKLLPAIDVVKAYDNPITVEGFTDSLPISSPTIPSNWALSAVRASSVVSVFNRLGVPDTQLSAIGYGANYPIATNQTATGRSKNRRIVVLIEAYARRKSSFEYHEAPFFVTHIKENKAIDVVPVEQFGADEVVEQRGNITIRRSTDRNRLLEVGP